MTQNQTEQQRTTAENTIERTETHQTSQSALNENERKRLVFLEFKNDLQSEIKEIEKGKEKEERKSKDERKKEFLDSINKSFNLENADKFKTFEDLKMTSSEKEEYETLKEKIKEHIQVEIKELRHDLINSIPENCFDGFPTEEDREEQEERGEKSFPISLNEMRLRLKDKLPDKLRHLFLQMFFLKLDLSNWNTYMQSDQSSLATMGDTKVDKKVDPETGASKFQIILDPTGCIEEKNITETVTFSYFSYNKLVYQITRAMLSTIKEKKELDDWCKKNSFGERIDKNNKKGSDDWLAMVLSDYEGCKTKKKIDPKFLDEANKWLENLELEDFKNPAELTEQITIKKLEINQKMKELRIDRPWKEHESEEHIHGIGLTVLEKFEAWGLGGIGKALYSIGATIGNIQIIDRQYIHMFLAEEDAKESKKLLLRDLSGSEYIPMLKYPQFRFRDKMRPLLLTIASKGYYQPWMSQYYLYCHDWVFRKTKGAEITHDSYDFISRLTKAYQKGVKGAAMAIPEYGEVGGKFLRRSFDKQVEIIDDVLETVPVHQITRIASDVFDMIRRKDGKFLEIDAKLSDKRHPDEKNPKNHFCATDDKYLENFLPKKQAEKFANDMEAYSQELHEPKFNNLVHPGAVALIRRLETATTEEGEIFSIYSSRLMRKAFEAYKGKVGEAEYTKKEYKKDFKETKDKIVKNNYDLDEVMKYSSYDEICKIYDDFVKKTTILPYVRGAVNTPRRRLDGFINQSREGIINNAKDKSVPEGMQTYIGSEIDKMLGKPLITNKDIRELRQNFYKKAFDYKLTDKMRYGLVKDLDKFLGDMENLGVVKQYARLFSPYQDKLRGYLPIKGQGKPISVSEAYGIKNHFITKIASESKNASEKIKDLGFKFPQIRFNDQEIKKILNTKSEKQNTEILSIISNKTEKLSQDPTQKLKLDYEELNKLYYKVNEDILNFQGNGRLAEFIIDFKSLNLVPDEIKRKPVPTLLDLRERLQLIKAVVSSHNAEKEKREIKQQNRLGTIGYSPEMENILEEEEEEALAAEELG